MKPMKTKKQIYRRISKLHNCTIAIFKETEKQLSKTRAGERRTLRLVTAYIALPLKGCKIIFATGP
jgi:hypothetical protein